MKVCKAHFKFKTAHKTFECEEGFYSPDNTVALLWLHIRQELDNSQDAIKNLQRINKKKYMIFAKRSSGLESLLNNVFKSKNCVSSHRNTWKLWKEVLQIRELVICRRIKSIFSRITIFAKLILIIKDIIYKI